MSIVNRNYVSDHTEWMRTQFEHNPDWEKTQVLERSRWWDKSPRDTVVDFETEVVKKKAYPYDVNFSLTSS